MDGMGWVRVEGSASLHLRPSQVGQVRVLQGLLRGDSLARIDRQQVLYVCMYVCMYVCQHSKGGQGTSSRSMPASLSPGVNLAMCSAGQKGKSSFQSCSDVTPGHTSSFGVPRILRTHTRTDSLSQPFWSKVGQTQSHSRTDLKILNISSISESPGNSGRLVTISARIVPTAHMSTGSA